MAHPGWGETLFIKEVFPCAKIIHFCEYFYRVSGSDLGFDPAFPVGPDDRARAISRNATLLMALELCDIGVAPTEWQLSLHPHAYRDKIRLLHEGVDTEYMRPDSAAKFVLSSGVMFKHGDQVITYVARNLEPYRGIHSFIEALPILLEHNKECHVIIAGGDGASYGRLPMDSPNWKTKLLEKFPVDKSRVHFVGNLSFENYRSLLQISAVHVYLTYPFVLSWSLLEAMSCGCVVVGSDTEPVRELIKHGDNGVMTDFFDSKSLAETVVEILAHRSRYTSMRIRARQTIKNSYSSDIGESEYKKMIYRLAQNN